MFQTEREIWAWLAGIIDCDGGFYIERSKAPWKRGKTYRPILQIANTNKAFLEKIKEILGFGMIRELKNAKSRNNKWKKEYELRIFANGIRRIVPNILPFLLIKREQALLIVEAVKITEIIRRTPPSKRDIQELEPYYERLEQLYVKMRELNKKGV